MESNSLPVDLYRTPHAALFLLLALWMLSSTGCGGARNQEGGVPDSASTGGAGGVPNAQSLDTLPTSERTSRYSVVTATLADSTAKPRISITMKYPQLRGEKQHAGLDRFNEMVAGMIRTTSEGFREMVLESQEEFEQGEAGEFGSYIESEYQATLATPELVSVRIVIAEYHAGAAHPNSYSSTLTYDLAKGKQVELSDLFRPRSNYLEYLSNLTRNRLVQTIEGAEEIMDMIKGGTEPVVENFERFTLGRDSLHIYFDPYQVGPYAIGPQEVGIPYPALGDLLSQEYAPARFSN